MISLKRPFLIVPKLIEQLTWGGRYILNYKNWRNLPFLKNKKIGQSYELFGQSKLLTKINDSQDEKFIPEVGSPDVDKIYNKTLYKKNVDYLTIDQLTKYVEKIPLIKFTQSNGNSFQIHIKKGAKSNRWLPKPESWYYFEDGLITFGIKRNINLEDYKKSCRIIEAEIKQLSEAIKKRKISLDGAKKAASQFIKKINPWQFVNLHLVKKFSVVDSSSGSIHHSWEEDLEKYPLGNVLYEIQKDVMDPVSTIRSFDKGKFKPDGSTREIHIEDYFKYLDTDPDHNDIKKMTPRQKGNRLLTTKYYCLDILEIDKEVVDNTNKSFTHLFVRDGKIYVECSDGLVILARGHSCFIPETVTDYKIKPIKEKAIVLKTFVEL